MAWADLLLPEDQLAAMLVECQPVRAIVANPAVTWAEIAAVLDGGAVAEGATAGKVVTSAFVEDDADSAFITRPRFAVSQLEQDGYTRTSVSGFDLSGQLFALAELSIPPSLVENVTGMKDDIRRKAMAIEIGLLRLPRSGDRLDLESVNVEAGIMYGAENNGEPFGLIQMNLTYRGSI